MLSLETLLTAIAALETTLKHLEYATHKPKVEKAIEDLWKEWKRLKAMGAGQC